MQIRIWLIKATLVISSIITLGSCTSKKTGYVDIFKLVNEFELQKEFTDQVKRDVDKEKAAIDSMVFAEKLKDPASSEHLRDELYTTLYQKTEQRNKEIESMIWARLNPYLVDFGKEKGYLYIYGANGTGNVLYADERENITDELIQYVNNRFHDKK